MRYLALTILLAACGGPDQSMTRHLKDATFDRVRVRVGSGSVTVRADSAVEGALFTTAGDAECGAKAGTLRVDADRADIELTVPPGLLLEVTTRSASVRVEGNWGGGKVQSATGDLDVTLGAPAKDFTFTSSGAVAVAVAKDFQGTVQVAGASVDVTSHPLLFEKWGERRLTMTGFAPKGAGPLQPKNLPHGIWVKSLKGRASFRLIDD